MIITKTPYRISFFGGGSDYPQWYLENGGEVISTTIDKYIYLSCRNLPPFFNHKHRIVWSKVELVKKESTFKKKKKVKKNISSGIAYVYSTFNNTIISIADESGNVISWSSAGAKGFKGSRKSTPYAAQVAADDAGAKAYEQGLRTLTVQVKGPGSGRETALRSLQSKGFKILSIKDTTPMPHNGARPPKKRRV